MLIILGINFLFVHFQGYNGMIELAKPKKEVISDVIYQRPILYKVIFPVWLRLPPRITKILVNGNLVCSGPKFPSKHHLQSY